MAPQQNGRCRTSAPTTSPAALWFVWDVDLLSEEVIKSYKASDPEPPVIFRRGDIADAEPAVPGWRIAVIDLFE